MAIKFIGGNNSYRRNKLNFASKQFVPISLSSSSVGLKVIILKRTDLFVKKTKT